MLTACGSASDLSLSAHVTDESLQVTGGAFSGLEGSFKLELVLGSEANGATQVSLGKMELQSEAGEFLADLGDALPEPMFPIDLGKGESKQVLFTLKDISVDRDAACAGRVRIVGSVTDTLKGGSVPVRGDAVTPDCS